MTQTTSSPTQRPAPRGQQPAMSDAAALPAPTTPDTGAAEDRRNG
ncbi:hypothetical protein [Candidatus Amarolinea dominans]